MQILTQPQILFQCLCESQAPYSESQRAPVLFWTPLISIVWTLFKIFPCILQKKEVISVWNLMRVSKWRQNAQVSLYASILMNMQTRVRKTEGCNSRLVGCSFPRLPRKPQGHNKKTNSMTDAANHYQMGNMLQI